MTMGYKAPSKKAIKDALKVEQRGFAHPLLDFRRNVQHTSFFHQHLADGEAQIPGTNLVVGPDAYTDRRWFATLTVDANGTVTGIK